MKTLREEKGLTQIQISEALGISRETVIAIEKSHAQTISTIEYPLMRDWFRLCADRASTVTRDAYWALLKTDHEAA